MEPAIFNLRVSVVPLWNVRVEFNRTLKILRAPEFREQIERCSEPGEAQPLHAYHIIWGGPPEGLLTWFLQRTIIGIEAYIPSALFLAAAHYGRLNENIIRAKDDPFAVRCASTADTFYNGLPGLVHSNFKLKRANGSLWKSVRVFYESVRNPLFHGSQLYSEAFQHVETLDAVLRTYEMFVQVYDWVDWWCPQRFSMGESIGGPIPISEIPSLPDTHPCGDAA